MGAEQKCPLITMAVAVCVDKDYYYPSPKGFCCGKGLGLHIELFKELVVSDAAGYRQLLHVSREQFVEILACVEAKIARQMTVMCQPIQAVTKLQVRLHHLVPGKHFSYWFGLLLAYITSHCHGCSSCTFLCNMQLLVEQPNVVAACIAQLYLFCC